MRLLFLNQYYSPDLAATGQYLTEMCEALAERHAVSVVAAWPSYSTAAEGPRRFLSREEIRGVTVWRTFATRFSRRTLPGRACNYLTYLLSSLWGGLCAGPADLVVAKTDPPLIGLVAWLVAKIRRAPFLQIFTDIYPEVAQAAGKADHPLIAFALERATRFLLRRADHSVTLGEQMKMLLLAKGGRAERLSVISDWADADELAPIPAAQNQFLAAQPWRDRFIVMHSGNMGVSQDLELLLEAAQRLQGEPQIVFALIGDGANRAALVEAARARGLRQVYFLPYQPRSLLAHSLSAAGVHYVSLKPGFEGAIVPCKIYGIWAAARPVVAAVSEKSELWQLVKASGAGLLVAKRDPDQLAAAIKKLSQDKDLARELGEKGRAYLKAHHEKKAILADYQALFERLAARKPK